MLFVTNQNLTERCIEYQNGIISQQCVECVYNADGHTKLPAVIFSGKLISISLFWLYHLGKDGLNHSVKIHAGCYIPCPAHFQSVLPSSYSSSFLSPTHFLKCSLTLSSFLLAILHNKCKFFWSLSICRYCWPNSKQGFFSSWIQEYFVLEKIECPKLCVFVCLN